MPPILLLLCLLDTGMALFLNAVNCSLKRERNGIAFLDIRFTPLFDVSTKGERSNGFRVSSVSVINLEQSLFQIFCLSRPSLCCPVALR